MSYILKTALAGSLIFGSPAMAATFIEGQSANIVFDGSQPNTSASLLLKLITADSLTNTFTFSYTFENTSDTVVNPFARVTGFGFNDDTNQSVFSATATGVFDTVSFGNNFPNELKNREVCVHVGNCLGGNEGVTAAMGPVTGSLVLDYTGNGLSQITLDNFAVRYISTGIDGQGSGTGIQNAVPEPSTWMLMLLGMAGVGFAMRRKEKQTLRVRFA